MGIVIQGGFKRLDYHHHCGLNNKGEDRESNENGIVAAKKEHEKDQTNSRKG